jgi:hypothetical protein
MALDDEKHYQMLTDYFQAGDAGEIPFGRSHAETQGFFDWFARVATQWPKSDELISRTRRYTTSGACFTNAQRNALESEMDYCEGFYKVPGRSYYVHGFNIYNGKAVDFTNQNNESAADIKYYGVIIPKELIKQYNPGVEIGEGEALGSLLYRYYLDSH